MPSINDFIALGLQNIERDARERAEYDDYRRAKRDLKELYNARKLERVEKVIVDYPKVSDDGISIIWYSAQFDGRDNANQFIFRHGITGARIKNALIK